MWTLHTAIPDLRDVEWDRKVDFQCKKRTSSMKYLLKKHNLNYKGCKYNSMVVYSKGNYFHHKKKNEDNKTTYYINLSLVEEVVGDNQDAIDGYVFELLAYGFFDKCIRESLKSNHKSKSLFRPNENTCLHDNVALKQYHKVFSTNA
ncbi:hypothetical protein AB6D08_25165 [Vibrio splendidus]